MKRSLKFWAVIAIPFVLVFSGWSEAFAGFKISDGDKSLELYGRIQPRYEWKEVDNPGDTPKRSGHDFYIRRTRIGLKVKLTDEIKGKLEWKLDNYLQEDKTPETKLENAFVSVDHFNSRFIVELGLQNSVFSREGQLSDSKLLFDDISKIVKNIGDEGLADNATGLHLKGKLLKKRLEYGLGIYEGGDGDGDDSTEGDRKDSFLYALGLVYHIYEPESRQGSHVGDGKKYLTVGTYYTAQNRKNVYNTEDISAYGADVFGQFGTATFSAGYFILDKDFDITADRKENGFYVEAAYLIPLSGGKALEFAARYQSYAPDPDPDEEQSSIGVNYYIKKHDIKVQGTYNFNEANGSYDPGDNFVVQLQFAW